MSGADEQTQTQSQQSTTNPWEPAIPALKNLLGKFSGMSGDLTGAQQTAANTLLGATSNLPNFGADASGVATKLFGSDTSGQIGMLSKALEDYKKNIGATASGAELDPYSTPGFSDAINKATGDITNKVKSVYAAAGRDPSGAGSFAGSLAGGLAEGIAPTIAAQFNTNNNNRFAAAKNLYDASGGTAGAITQQGQVPLQNMISGVGLLPQIMQAYTAPGATALNAANTVAGLPIDMLSKVLGPIAQIGGMGGSSSGTATGTTTQPQSLMSNILGGVTGGLGLMNLLGGSGASSIGLLGLLSDENAKENIKEVGELHDGQPVYSYTYKGDNVPRIGLLAQEVEKVVPDAVGRMGEFKTVDYGRATRRAAAMKEAA